MQRLELSLPVPSIHDDQYGTATVAIAALLIAWKLLGRSPKDEFVVINGAGAAGSAIFELISHLGVGGIIVNERDGILNSAATYAMLHHNEIALRSNHDRRRGRLSDAVRGASVFVGVSVGNQLSAGMVSTMQPQPVVLALTDPDPDITPEDALAGGAAIVATGRFDYPNQCNNVLAFPALMRAALDTRARRLNTKVYLAAAAAISEEIGDAELSPTNILSSHRPSTVTLPKRRLGQLWTAAWLRSTPGQVPSRTTRACCARR